MKPTSPQTQILQSLKMTILPTKHAEVHGLSEEHRLALQVMAVRHTVRALRNRFLSDAAL
eukprot:EC716691.1.p3 GENE.EC716691.1~~EC716691.1.p3  ORF type:complete len:60 (-),score=1.71 EC716691.1:214-393(-)